MSTSSHHHSWNLHSVWDTGIIEVALQRDYDNSRQAMERDLLAQSYANDTVYDYCPDQGSDSSCTIQWGQESFALALQYAYLDAEDEQEIHDGSTLTEAYYQSRLVIVKDRLVAAGVRLAATLEVVYKHNHPHKNAVTEEDEERVATTTVVPPNSNPKGDDNGTTKAAT